MVMTESAQVGLLGSVQLTPERRAVGQARSFTRHTLRAAGLAEFLDDAELVVSELVTNAVVAAELVAGDRAACAGRAALELRLRRTGWSLLVAVWDSTPMPPVLKSPTECAEGGRGLFLVEQLCERWNFFYSVHGGKLVWAELGLAARRPAPADPV
jgi:anti-sigma regulatory factor (Ser/Thr protein kinase)